MVHAVDTINCFKSRLDKFLTNQDVVYIWEADFTGTGNRSLCSLQRFFLNFASVNRDEDTDTLSCVRKTLGYH